LQLSVAAGNGSATIGIGSVPWQNGLYHPADISFAEARKTMNIRHSWIVAGAIVAGCALLGLLCGQPSVAQQKNEPGALLRYQIASTNQQTGKFVVLDTATGHCWSNYDGYDSWKDLGVPPKPKP
jgi:hypothetical protein